MFRLGRIEYGGYGTGDNERLELRACMLVRGVEYTDSTSNGDRDKLVPGCKGEVDRGGSMDDCCSA